MCFRRFILGVLTAGLGSPALEAAPLNGRDPVDDVFYQFMPIAWRDSDNDASRFGDFGGMTASLDYLQGLGVTAVWMTPIFPSVAYHGYQHGRADQLNNWFGTEPQFWSFVQAAHARGMKVFIDFVVYQIDTNAPPYFQSAYNNPASPYDTWLAFTNSANTTYYGGSGTTWNGQSHGYINWNLNDPNPTSLEISWRSTGSIPTMTGIPRMESMATASITFPTTTPPNPHGGTTSAGGTTGSSRSKPATRMRSPSPNKRTGEPPVST